VNQRGPAQLIMMCVGLGFLMMLIAKSAIGFYLVALVLTVALLCAAYLYIHRFERPLAIKVYRNPVGKPVLDLLGGLTQLQPPIALETGDAPSGDTGHEASTYSALVKPADFEIAKAKILEEVVGHDAALDVLMDDIQQSVMLRVKRPDCGDEPLTVCLLAGRNGVGKRLLATAVAKQVYPEGGILVLDAREYSDATYGIEDLFGGSGGGGRLLTAVRGNPLHTVIIRGVESAHADVLERLTQVIQEGRCVDPATGSEVSFKHVMVFFCSTKAERSLAAIAAEWRTDPAWTPKAKALLIETTGFPPLLAETVRLILPVQTLSQLDKASVIARLMQQECQRHRVTLTEIDPQILAEEVARIGDARGFQGVHSRVRARLRDDLAKAVEISMPQMRLIQRLPKAEREVR